MGGGEMAFDREFETVFSLVVNDVVHVAPVSSSGSP
jgi:hypothetical protein